MTRYDTDFYEWALEQASLLRLGDLDGLDTANLAEEIESLGKSNRRELSARLQQIVEHMLKLDYTRGALRESNLPGWRRSIVRQHDELGGLFSQSPSLRREVADFLPDAYRRAARIVRMDYEIEVPESCPWSTAEILGTEWLDSQGK